jgi:hypothetical protein
MPAFTLYGSRGSTNTDRVRLTLAEGGFTDYELVLLNLHKGEQKVSGLSPGLQRAIRVGANVTLLHLVQRTQETSPVG